MIRIKTKEYVVRCRGCQAKFTFDSPEDLRKETIPDYNLSPVYSVVCPSCGKENRIFDCLTVLLYLPDEFIERVKEKT